jgi:N-acetylmuramate 1-kinase
MDDRQLALSAWVESLSPVKIKSWQPLAGDASFRRYFRVLYDEPMNGATQWIAVDSPPHHENQQRFLEVRSLLAGQQLPVPFILAEQADQSFMLLSDFGDQLLLGTLNDANANNWYVKAIALIATMQTIPAEKLRVFSQYDAVELMREMQLFDDWFIQQYLGLTISPEEVLQLRAIKDLLIKCAQSQRQGFVHRDFHCRNLMVTAENTLGLIDFQDAIMGPCTYDVVSLLKDAYIEWPYDLRIMWLNQLYQRLSLAVDFETFERWFDWMGLQRHLKVLGIFTRLKIRDHKAGYEQYLPRVMRYVLEVVDRYPEFASLRSLLNQKLLPAWQKGYGVSL